MNIIYSKKAIKVISSMDRVAKQKIKTAIEKLPDGDVKQIKSRGLTTYRLRIGDWRVLYSFDSNKNLHIEKIGSRGDFYKGV